MKIKRMVVSPLQTNCYIVYENQKAFLIDPGDQAKKIKKFIEENELEVVAILLTHGHIDHIGAIDSLQQSLSCPIYLQEEDFPYLQNPALNLSTNLGQPLVSNAKVLKAPENLNLAGVEIKWHHLPGHTPGSSMIEFVEQKIIFSGDVLFKGSIGRYDFPGSSHYDTLESITKIKEMDQDARVFPGHGEMTTLKEEQMSNPFLNH